MILETDIQNLLEGKQYRPAFELLVERMQIKVFHLCLGILRDPASAEDAAQECFVKVWRGLPGYGAQASLSTWIYAIARNTCLSELRRRAGRPAVSLQEEGITEQVERELPGLRDHEPRLQPSEMERLLNQLSTKHQRVLRLYYYEQRSYEEVAQMLDLPLGTVKTDLYRAKRELLREIQRSQAHELRAI